MIVVMNSAVQPMVSVIIPCYNQGHFLGEAIDSIYRQNYPNCKIVVVDDGSTDKTGEVAASFDGVIYLRQQHQGPSVARNAGFQHSQGAYVVFLDADDRLLPDALHAGADFLDTHQEAVFVYGQYVYIDEDGRRLPGSSPCRPEGDDYSALLRGRNFIVTPTTVMFRRTTLEQVGEFDTSLARCGDYELFLRCARHGLLGRLDRCVAEYRQHATAYSRNNRLNLISGLAIIRSQWPYVKENELYREAYREGLKSWRTHFGKKFLNDVTAKWREGNRSRMLLDLADLARFCPGILLAAVNRQPNKLYQMLRSS
jgi:glycosyltransferase involved in cell wall biosynthesis